MKRASAVLFAVVASAAQAARFESLEVTHQSGLYSVRAAAWLDAPPAEVRAALVDYARLTRLSPSIRESRLLRETPDGPLVYVRSRACAAWFCRDLKLTQLVTDEGMHIVAVALPEQSNVTVGRTEWTLAPEAGGTRLEWGADLDPVFFIPPLIGPPLMKSALRREGELLAEGIERAARGEPPPEPKRKRYQPRGAGRARHG